MEVKVEPTRYEEAILVLPSASFDGTQYWIVGEEAVRIREALTAGLIAEDVCDGS